MVSLCVQQIPFILLWFITKADATNPLTLCSSENTGDLKNAFFSIYNSYGSCTNHCSGYAYAILQGQNCWCSNESPGSTTSVGDCSESCPGFNSDRCGNADKGLFGYAQIGQPSGTQQASSSDSSTKTTSSSSTSSSDSTSSTPSTTSQSSTSSTSTTSSASSSASAVPSSTDSSKTGVTTSNSSPSQSSSGIQSSASSVSSSASASPAASSSASSTSSSTSSSSSSTPSTSSSASAASSASTGDPTKNNSSPSSTASSTDPSASDIGNQNKKSDKDGYWQQGGKVAGTFVGVGIAVLIILGLIIFFCCLRRRRAQAAKEDSLGVASARTGNSPKSPFGSGSKFTTQREGGHAFAPFANGSLGRHTRVQSGDSAMNDSDFVPIFDQRVDPNQLYMRFEHNGSNTSLQDYEDYSRRVLQVANPDER